MYRMRQRTCALLLLCAVVFVGISLMYNSTWDAVLTKRDEFQYGADGHLRKMNYTVHDAQDTVSLEMEMIHRRTVVERICRRLKITRRLKPFTYDDLKHILVDDKNKILYCYVPKVASTNWKRILLILKNANVSHNPLDIPANDSHRPEHFHHLNEFPASSIRHRLRTYLKFVFVRHPFERLLSAYRNKFENSYGDYFRERFGRTIVQRHRPNASAQSLVTGDDVTFAEFVEYLLDPQTLADGPLNEHWQAINDLCSPCHVHYTLVGKYESLDVEAQHVLDEAGVGQAVKFPRINRTVDTLLLLESYFKNVTRENIFRLFQMYVLDFKMFGYKFPNVDSYAPD